MPSLNYFLDRSKQLCNSIQSLKFQSPGIFTNSFIKEPSITSLLKDAADHEQALYKINKPARFNKLSRSIFMQNNTEDEKDSIRLQLEVKPERIDGKSYYVDYSFNDFTNTNINNSKEAPSVQSKRTAVRIPEIIKDTIENVKETKETPSSPEKIINSSLIPESIILSNDINDICDTILSLIRRYPNLIQDKSDPETSLLNDIVVYHQEYNSLINEINELEDVVAEQRDQLNFYNISLSERSQTSPARGSKRPREEHSEDVDDLSEDVVDIDELIMQEEKEIEDLEDQLTKRQKVSI